MCAAGRLLVKDTPRDKEFVASKFKLLDSSHLGSPLLEYRIAVHKTQVFLYMSILVWLCELEIQNSGWRFRRRTQSSSIVPSTVPA